MKRIGILYDKDSKKVFLLPEQVKQLTSKGIVVNVAAGLGQCLGINDSTYLSAGARIFKQYRSVIDSSDIIVKASSFVKSEAEHMNGKIAITTANFVSNVDMLYYLLTNNAIGCEWLSLKDKSEYVFFPELEAAKANLIMVAIKQAIAKGLDKHKKPFPIHPRILILNASECAVAIAKLALKDGFEVTIADEDPKYAESLRRTLAFAGKINVCDAHYETILEQVRDKNIFITTTISPSELTKLRITKEMAVKMPEGSLLVDASCQNGYAFHFIKKYADKELKWNEVEKRYYLAPADMTELVARTACEIISKKSVQYLIDIADKGAASPCLSKVIVCQDGKVVDETINKQLRLY